MRTLAALAILFPACVGWIGIITNHYDSACAMFLGSIVNILLARFAGIGRFDRK